MMKIALVPILLCFLIACGGRPKTSPSDVRSGPAADSPPPSDKSYKTVEIDSLDGTPIVGSLYAADKPNSPALLLLHQWQSDRHSFDDFAARMQARGFAVLAIDGRGFGESNHHANGSMLSPGRTDADVKAMLGDVEASFNYLSKQPNVDPKRVGIVGASYGSSLAIIYAVDHPSVGAVALLSPGLNYFGNMQTEPAARKYGDRDLFTIASKGDTESAEAAESFEKIGNTRYGFMILPVGSAHGTEMFKYRDKTDGPPVVEDALEFFLTTRLGLARADYK